ncbi:hypothetical protein ACH4E7_42500 [Kitasatospora sp. NPDC018058]
MAATSRSKYDRSAVTAGIAGAKACHGQCTPNSDWTLCWEK